MKARHPRINCCIIGCKRGSTQCEPGCLIICGKCWRKAPKALRTRHTDCLRLMRKYQRRLDTEKARVFELRADRIWSSIRAILNDDELQEMPEQLPALMAEELRRMGIV